MTRARVLVIGGGVSGNAAAIRFAHRGHRVVLMERATFPREKVCGCCLGAAGMAALEAIGVADEVRRCGLTTKSFSLHLHAGATRQSQGLQSSHATTSITTTQPIVSAKLPIHPGISIARSALDTLMCDHSRRVGVDVRQPVEGRIVSLQKDSVEVVSRPTGSTTWNKPEMFDLVVLASGLSGVFRRPAAHLNDQPATEPERTDLALQWEEPPHGPLGVSTHLPGDHVLAKRWPLDDGEIAMVCGDDGYVGLVRLPDGAIDIAAALSAPAAKSDRATKRVLREKAGNLTGNSNRVSESGDVPPRNSKTEAAWPNLASRLLSLLKTIPQNSSEDPFTDGEWGEIAHWLDQDAVLRTAPQLRRRRVPGQGRVVAIGDCAGYVEPLTGEGMTWGIESGLAVADLWEEWQFGMRSGCHSQNDQLDFAEVWHRRFSRLQPKRRRWCGWITGAVRHRWARRSAGFGLARAAWLAKPVTNSLASGPGFEKTSDQSR